MSFSQKKRKSKEPVLLSGIVENSINTLVRTAIPSTINIAISIQKNIPLVLANVGQIQQIVVNLCSNAALAIDDEKGIIQIDLQEISLPFNREPDYQSIPPGNYVQLTVSDNGKGMTEEILGRIFDPYFTTREVGQGTGMGLAFVQSIVIDHGAEILVHSDEGRGTRVKILFKPLIGHASL